MMKLISTLFFTFLLPKTTLSSCENCEICDENNDCLKCMPGYSVTDYNKEQNNYYCSKCDKSCKACRDYLYFDCTECYDGYYLENQTGLPYGYCRECENENCASCEKKDGVYRCLKCNDGYFLDGNNECQKCYETCLTCTGTGSNQCLTCVDGFFSSSGEREHSCVKCAPFCKKCHGSNIADCDECVDGYYFTNGECRTCSSDCATCSGERTHCTSCKDGFYLDGSKCLKCTEHCKKCTGPGEYDCTDCFDGYVARYGYCQDCTLVAPNGCPKCKYVENYGVKCTQCPPGYRVVSDNDDDEESIDCYPCYIGNCYSCPTTSYSCERCNDHFYLESEESCASCQFPCFNCIDSPTKCTSCYEHYHFDSNTNTCKECPENCLECDSNLKCTKCNNTYYPKDGVCARCDKSCYNCHDGSNACDECAIGYHFNELNRCVPCPEHCDRCDSTQCTVCATDFYPVDGICSPCADVCAHCNGPTADDCITCDDGFYFSDFNQACFACDKACATCNGGYSYSCQTCSTGYFKNDYRCSKCEFNCLECESLRNCLKCNDGFRLYVREGETDNDCQPCKNRGCKKCDSAADQCTECIDGFYPSPTGKDNFVDCVRCPPDCKSCSKNQQGQVICNTCNDGFYGENGICIRCDSSCATCSSRENCLSCANGYLFDGVSKCNTKCSSNCLSCEQDPDKCTSCPNGYYLSGTKCKECYEGCKTCESSWGELRCTSCQDGYYLGDNENYIRVCLKCNEQCATCTSKDELSCTSCAPGFYFTQMNTDPYNPYTGKCESCSKDNSNCLECIENCNDNENFDCEPLPICTKCVDGYYVDSNNACKRCDKSCGTCVGPSIYDCVTCAEGLLFSEDVCVGCSDSCLTCDIVPNNCTSCAPGKFLKGSTCNQCNLDKCAECAGNENHCTKCQAGKYLYENNCYSSCTEAGINLGLNQTTNECYKCQLLDNCIEYDLSCKCFKCQEGYYHYEDPLTNKEICSPCKPDNCKVCEGFEINDCTECFDGFYLSTNSETSLKECKQCKEPCLRCSGDDGSTCHECDIGFEVKDGKCEKMAESCKENEHCNIGGSDKTDYANYTTHLPSYEGVTNDESGGAIQVINGGLSSKDCTFTSCISNNGGGGGIYIYNNIPNAQSSYSIKLRNITFEGCKANFGAALYIYSPSEKSPVKIDSCEFINNELLPNGNSKVKGGSAIHLVAKDCQIIKCKFAKNKGKGGVCKVSDDFDVTPESLKLLSNFTHKNNFKKISVKIVDCTFDVDKSSDCSLFYSGDFSSSKIIINDCVFTGNLNNKAHFIDGSFAYNDAPKIYINSCSFSADESKALNSKLFKVDSNYKTQNTFAKNQEPSNMLPLLTLILSLATVFIVIVAVIVIKKLKQSDELHERSNTHEA